MSTPNHAHGHTATVAIAGISNAAITAALTTIDKAKTMPKGFLTTLTGEVKKLNGMLMDAGDIKIVAKKIVDVVTAKYETPLALRNAHLGHDPQLKRFADKAKAFGVDIDFGDVGRMLEIAREGFGADVVALDTRRDTGSARLDSPGGFNAIKAAPVVGTVPHTDRSDGRRIAG